MNTSHERVRNGKDEWLTPPDIIKTLGVFDLDPCSPINRPWDTANRHLTIQDNGLEMDWGGRIWLNPPYGKELKYWMEKMADHANGIALTFARTDTQVFHTSVFDTAVSLLFIKGRIKFHHVSGKQASANSGAPSVLIAYSMYDADMLEDSNIVGKHISTSPLCFITLREGTWRTVVGRALHRLNREASLQEIYDMVYEIAPQKIRGNSYYKEKVRQTLQYHYTRVHKGIYK